MSSTEPTPTKPLYVHRGAPEPILLRFKANDTLVSFDNTLKFTYVNDAGTVTLTVGDGITLSTDEGVTDSRATVQLTVEQSRDIPEGGLTRYEVQRTIAGRESVFLMGALIGEGGDNPDA